VLLFLSIRTILSPYSVADAQEWGETLGRDGDEKEIWTLFFRKRSLLSRFDPKGRRGKDQAQVSMTKRERYCLREPTCYVTNMRKSYDASNVKAEWMPHEHINANAALTSIILQHVHAAH
jgi:hypothetical protein